MFLKYIAISFLLSVLSMNVPAMAQTKNDSPATTFVLMYGNEFTFGLCVLVLILSSWLSLKLPSDDTVKPEMSNPRYFQL